MAMRTSIPKTVAWCLSVALALGSVSVAREAVPAFTSEQTFDSLIRDDVNGYLGGKKTMLDFSKQHPALVHVSAATLAAAFTDNGLAADAKYGGRQLVITGLFKGARRGIMNNAYVEVGDRSDFSHGAQLFIVSDAVTEAATLKPGQAVELMCDGAKGAIMEATAKDCVFFETYKTQIGNEVVASIRHWLSDGTPSPYVETPDLKKFVFTMHLLILRSGLTCSMVNVHDSCESKFMAVISRKSPNEEAAMRSAYAENETRLGLPALPPPKTAPGDKAKAVK